MFEKQMDGLIEAAKAGKVKKQLDRWLDPETPDPEAIREMTSFSPTGIVFAVSLYRLTRRLQRSQKWLVIPTWILALATAALAGATIVLAVQTGGR